MIGVDDYGFAPLSSAVNDALAVRDALAGGDGGTPIVAANDITLLLAPRDGADLPAGAIRATRDAILDALHPHYVSDDPADILIVYFAGHGMSVSPDGRSSETVILPVDTEAPDKGRNMVPVDELVRLMAMRGPLRQLYIVDACRDMPYDRRPRGYGIDWNEEPAQTPRQQTRIHAVAQGGMALADMGGMGRFTQHLLDGLTGRGCALDHQPGVGHVVTAASLFYYVRRRIAEALEGYDDYTRTIQEPQMALGSEPLTLRPLPPPDRRPFTVAFDPPEAREAVRVTLEVEPRFPVPGWPPDALPRIYELRARLRDGAAGWGEPDPGLAAVDLREEDTALIRVRRAEGPGAPGLEALEAATPRAPDPMMARFGIAPAATASRAVSGPPNSLRGPTGPQPAFLQVETVDPGARVVLTSPEGAGTTLVGTPGEDHIVAAGAWDVRIELGSETISAARVVLGPYERRVLTAHAQITPALAALLSPDFDTTDTPPVSIMPSETIGPMQGAILPTLLPVLALKPIDAADDLLHQFAHLDIPRADVSPDGVVAIAVVREGVDGRASAPVRGPAGADYGWRAPDGRLALFLTHARSPRGTVAVDLGDGRSLDMAAPMVPGAVTVVALTTWPSGRVETALHIFRLPIGSAWRAEDGGAPAGVIARATALAARAFRAGDKLWEVPNEVIAQVAYAKWIDPVLGVLAFHSFAERLRRPHDQPSQDVMSAREMIGAISANMMGYFAMLPDSRIIGPHDEDTDAWHAALAPLLDDPSLGEPILGASLARLANAAIAAGRPDHWSVERSDRLVPGEIFNALVMPAGREQE
ncbi:MAG: hypothetical protein AcusKO_18640 [Acuticoccus sp.]